jgi:lysophospholipid acyltransferase (LPLAT)-like uncharacterized protein
MSHVRHPQIPAGKSVLYAHWHGDELLLISAYRHSRMAIMASRSKDGELQTRFLQGLGYHVVRGSSSRGGAGGLKGLVDAVTKEGWNASLAVDGPRGPVYQVKGGIVKLAQVTGCEIIPGAAAASRRLVFKKAWNKAFLPLPFSKCVVVYCESIKVPKEADDAELERLRLRLEGDLISLKVEAEKIFHRSFDKTGCSAVG